VGVRHAVLMTLYARADRIGLDGVSCFAKRSCSDRLPFRPIALNNLGEGQPYIHNAYVNNQFLDTRDGAPNRCHRQMPNTTRFMNWVSSPYPRLC